MVVKLVAIGLCLFGLMVVDVAFFRVLMVLTCGLVLVSGEE